MSMCDKKLTIVNDMEFITNSSW